MKTISITAANLNTDLCNRSRLSREIVIITRIRKALLLSLFIFAFASVRATAQEKPQVFSLPDARTGEAYRANVEDVLRDRYGLKISSMPRAILLWSIAGGERPPGISVRTDGTVAGTPTANRVDDYQFRLKVVDASDKDDELLINLSVIVKPERLRLSQFSGPRLVPIDMRSDQTKRGSSSPYNGSSPVNEKQPVTNSGSASDLGNQARNDQQKTPAELEAEEKVKKAAQKAESAKADLAKAVGSPVSSLNKRFIVGFEQTGAAASESTSKPFFNIFINTPLSHKDDCLQPDCLPGFSIWGDVRLTSTAEQINALADVASDSINAITGGKLNQIASAFDFTVGPEVHLANFNKTNLSLIAGFGAVSPLSPTQSAQIFEVPKQNSSQAAAFFQKFPGANGKDQIAFISPDRDRFLRHYFGGFRFKTYNVCVKVENCQEEGLEPGQLRQAFPATFDVTFGQDEAVTGGRLHKFVVGLDGFYPLPFPDKTRFLYLFGSAKLKAGGPKNHDTPFILATAASSVKITDPSVFIADPTPINRDTYRIGFGVDLFELFKFAKDKGAEQAGKN
jgi:hypothetical protein